MRAIIELTRRRGDRAGHSGDRGVARRIAALSAGFLLALGGPAAARAADLRGHGGPVRAIDVAPAAGLALTGSFDGRSIVWSLDSGAAREVLLFHDGQVNAVAVLPGGGYATAGEDGRIALWDEGGTEPVRSLEGHAGPVSSLAVSPDGDLLASASWDGTVRLWPLAGGGDARVLAGHQGNVNAVAFLSDGRLASAGYDGSLIRWPVEDDGPPAVTTMPAPLNALAALPGGRLAAGAADGHVRLIDGTGAVVADTEIDTTPVVALAVSPDGERLGVACLPGAVTILDADTLDRMRRIESGSLLVWSLAFTPDGNALLAGGSDRVVHRVDLAGGAGTLAAGPPAEDPLAAYAGDPGAEVFRACVACHTLDPAEGERAGPTLHGIFGRRIASVPGYHYSAAFRSLDIVWTRETVARLFEVGPASFTPGTKMPEQTIPSPEQRDALIRFLERATRPD